MHDRQRKYILCSKQEIMGHDNQAQCTSSIKHEQAQCEPSLEHDQEDSMLNAKHDQAQCAPSLVHDQEDDMLNAKYEQEQRTSNLKHDQAQCESREYNHTKHKPNLEHEINPVLQEHFPVMKEEVVDLLTENASKNACFIDATFGRGGHTKALLDRGYRVIALDRDPSAQFYANQLLLQYPSTFIFYNMRFSNINTLLKSDISGILWDFGLSTPQIKSNRGFSFDKNDFLDMNMGLSDQTACQIINTYSEKQLADMFFFKGDESLARVYAKRIIQLRKRQKINTMFELLKIINKRHSRLHPATKILQALRMEVNNELEEIEEAIDKVLRFCMSCTKLDLILVCISFHSGEDRIVKHEFKNILKKEGFDQKFDCKMNKKPLTPTLKEIKNNPPSRSAKLRWCRITNNEYYDHADTHKNDNNEY